MKMEENEMLASCELQSWVEPLAHCTESLWWTPGQKTCKMPDAATGGRLRQHSFMQANFYKSPSAATPATGTLIVTYRHGTFNHHSLSVGFQRDCETFHQHLPTLIWGICNPSCSSSRQLMRGGQQETQRLHLPALACRQQEWRLIKPWA